MLVKGLHIRAYILLTLNKMQATSPEEHMKSDIPAKREPNSTIAEHINHNHLVWV